MEAFIPKDLLCLWYSIIQPGSRTFPLWATGYQRTGQNLAPRVLSVLSVPQSGWTGLLDVVQDDARVLKQASESARGKFRKTQRKIFAGCSRRHKSKIDGRLKTYR